MFNWGLISREFSSLFWSLSLGWCWLGFSFLSNSLDSCTLEFLWGEWKRVLEWGVIDESLSLGKNFIIEGVEIIKEISPESLGVIVGTFWEGDEVGSSKSGWSRDVIFEDSDEFDEFLTTGDVKNGEVLSATFIVVLDLLLGFSNDKLKQFTFKVISLLSLTIQNGALELG